MYQRTVFAPRRRPRIGRWLLLAIALLLIGIGIVTAFDNGRVVVRTQRVYVTDLPAALEGFAVLHISDLNGASFGPGQKQLANALKDRKYNAVCITGDMIGPRQDAFPFYELLAALDPTKPVYLIAGDSDPMAVGGQPAGYYTVLADWVLGAQTRGATYLGAPASLRVANATIWFTDALQLTVDLDAASAAYAAAATDVSTYYGEIVELTRQLRPQMKEEDLHIALSHKPIGGETLQRMLQTTGSDETSFVRTVDIFLAGSTVGGQWRLPFAGPVWSDGWFPDDALVRGYHYAGAASLVQNISAGLGTDPQNPLPGFRLFNTPEVTLLTFTAEMDGDTLPQ